MSKILKNIDSKKATQQSDNQYEHNEKSTKFFLNLEKQQGSQNTIKTC